MSPPGHLYPLPGAAWTAFATLSSGPGSSFQGPESDKHDTLQIFRVKGLSHGTKSLLEKTSIMLELTAFPIPSAWVGRRSKSCYALCPSTCENIHQQCPFWCGGIWPSPTWCRNLGPV